MASAVPWVHSGLMQCVLAHRFPLPLLQKDRTMKYAVPCIYSDHRCLHAAFLLPPQHMDSTMAMLKELGLPMQTFTSASQERRRTRVGGVAGAAQHRLQAQEVLLAHAARVAEVLPASQLRELHEDDLDEEERVGVQPVPGPQQSVIRKSSASCSH